MTPNDTQLISHLFIEHTNIHMANQELEKLQNGLNDTCRVLGKTNDCQCCNNELMASCKGRLPSYTHDFVSMMEQLMVREESSLKNDSAGLALCQLEHDKLWPKVNQLAFEIIALAEQGKVAEGYFELNKEIKKILEVNDEYQFIIC